MGQQCADAQRREKILMRRLANKEQEFQDYVVSTSLVISPGMPVHHSLPSEPNSRVQGPAGAHCPCSSHCPPRSCRQSALRAPQKGTEGHQVQAGGDPERALGMEVHPGLEHRQASDGQVPAALPGERGAGQDDLQRQAGQAGDRAGHAEELQRGGQEVSVG